MRSLFPTNAALVLDELWMGGEFWHFFSSARTKFLDYTLALERKIAGLPKTSGGTVRMIFCGDRIRWNLATSLRTSPISTERAFSDRTIR